MIVVTADRYLLCKYVKTIKNENSTNKIYTCVKKNIKGLESMSKRVVACKKCEHFEVRK